LHCSSSLYRLGDRRDLHSFPTRRSSDLGLGYVIDLLAAVPSVVFGLWGILVLAPAVQPFYAWLFDNLHWIPLFAGERVSGTGRRSEEHTSELQSRENLVCRLLLEKKKDD